MTSISDAKKRYVAALTEIGIERSEAIKEAEILVEEFCGYSRAAQIVHGNDGMSYAAEIRLSAVIEKRSARVPIQYCLGSADFMGMKLAVEPGVLIPRCDTETVVEVAKSAVRARFDLIGRNATLSVFEIGIGSGAISLALLREFSNLHVVACDISATACRVARENAERMGLSDRLDIVHSDWRAMPERKFALVVSNPPYIAASDKAGLAPEVGVYEPAEALFAEEEGLILYRQFAEDGKKYLDDGGVVVFEIGDRQAASVVGLFQSRGWDEVESAVDLNGLSRVVTARKNIKKC